MTPRITIAATALTAACASAGHATGARPRLTSVEPASVQLIAGNVTTIELRGSNYATGERTNTVRIGSLTLTNVPSPDGKVIRVAIPDAIPSGGEAPPARWMGGSYPVWVTTAAGSSDTVSVVISAGGRAP